MTEPTEAMRDAMIDAGVRWSNREWGGTIAGSQGFAAGMAVAVELMADTLARDHRFGLPAFDGSRGAAATIVDHIRSGDFLHSPQSQAMLDPETTHREVPMIAGGLVMPIVVTIRWNLDPPSDQQITDRVNEFLATNTTKIPYNDTGFAMLASAVEAMPGVARGSVTVRPVKARPRTWGG